MIEACSLLSQHPQGAVPFLNKPFPLGTVKVWPNNGERLYAVGNTVRVLDSLYEENTLIGIIDADDQLCEKKTLEWINSIYKAGSGVVWTHPWVSSHFRTFPLSLYKEINQDNFKDEEGNWMKRCEDQTFMLPIIHKAHQHNLRTFYLEKPCYLYRGYQEIGGEEHQYQLNLERFIRSRGFIA